jgi:hypothetical protein
VIAIICIVAAAALLLWPVKPEVTEVVQEEPKKPAAKKPRPRKEKKP